MKSLRTTAFIILFIPCYLNAQDYSLYAGARSEGIGHSTVSVVDVFSTFHNPSLLAWNTENWVGLSGRNHFSVSTMNSAYAAGSFNLNAGNAGFNFKYDGSSTFYNLRAGGYFAKGFGEIFSASVGLNLYQHKIQGYDASFAFTADLGATAKIDKATIGVYWGNLNDAEYNGTSTEEIATYLRYGATYNFTDYFLITVEGVQDLGNDFGIRTGIEYVIEDIIGVRGGYSSLPELLTTGISVYINEWSIDMAGSWHPQLGFSPHIGGTFIW